MSDANVSVEFEVVQDGCVQYSSVSLVQAKAYAAAAGPWAMSIYETTRRRIVSNGKEVAAQAPSEGDARDAARYRAWRDEYTSHNPGADGANISELLLNLADAWSAPEVDAALDAAIAAEAAAGKDSQQEAGHG